MPRSPVNSPKEGSGAFLLLDEPNCWLPHALCDKYEIVPRQEKYSHVETNLVIQQISTCSHAHISLLLA